MMMSTLMMAAAAPQQSAIVYNIWYISTISTPSAVEMPTATQYMQVDGWMTATITANTVTETPVPSVYFYMPTNNWLLTNSIATPAAVERPTITQYWTYA